MSFKVLIVEDEEQAAKRLVRLLHDIDPDFAVVHTCEGIVDTIHWLSEHQPPDLGLFDVQLSDGVSFEILRRIPVDFPVIFTTAYDEYALQALKNSAIDYLLKPINEMDLAAALSKFKKSKQILNESALFRLMSHYPKSETPDSGYISRFRVHTGTQLKTVPVDDIAYFIIQNKGVYIITKKNEKYLIDHNLDEIEGMVNPRKFFRINRQFVVSLEAIQRMTTYTKSRVKLFLEPDPGIETITSVERSAEFKAWLEG